jgi:hypothetical protein
MPGAMVPVALTVKPPAMEPVPLSAPATTVVMPV